VGIIKQSLYIFRVSPHQSSGVLKTVTAASGTGHNMGTATFLQRGQVGVLESRSGHVGVNKYLHTVASSWIFMNME
jgi:hypothetical protein